MKRKFLSVAAVMVTVLLLSRSTVNQAQPVANDQKESADKFQVKIDNFSFQPEILMVTAGSIITWVNQDDVPHSIVSSEGKTLKSPVLDTDQKFSYTFDQPGTYAYFCGIHPRMVGKVIVQAGGGPN